MQTLALISFYAPGQSLLSSRCSWSSVFLLLVFLHAAAPGCSESRGPATGPILALARAQAAALRLRDLIRRSSRPSFERADRAALWTTGSVGIVP